MQRIAPVRRPAHAGFGYRGMTLVELIVVITISGILAAILGSFMVRAVQGYTDQVRRAALVDAAETTLRRMARDIRRALPNSVRVRDSAGNVDNVNCSAAGATCAIEMLNVADGARYREGPGQLVGPPLGHDHAPAQFWLRFGAADSDGFNVVGFFNNLTLPFVSNNSTNPARLAIYNLGPGIPTANAYADAGAAAGTPVVITNPAVTTFTINTDSFGDEHHVTLTSGSFRFRHQSPYQRVFVVDTPVSYLCASGDNGTITRFQNYTVSAAQPIDPAAAPLAGGTNGLLATPVTACAFRYTAGTAQRSGLVTLDITVSDGASGDTVRLLHQVHVDNAP
jgi:MSHA biogenesis protein MshO